MAVGRINEVAALTGFFTRKCIIVLPGKKQRNNEVAIRRGSTVIFNDNFKI